MDSERLSHRSWRYDKGKKVFLKKVKEWTATSMVLKKTGGFQRGTKHNEWNFEEKKHWLC